MNKKLYILVFTIFHSQLNYSMNGSNENSNYFYIQKTIDDSDNSVQPQDRKLIIGQITHSESGNSVQPQTNKIKVNQVKKPNSYSLLQLYCSCCCIKINHDVKMNEKLHPYTILKSDSNDDNLNNKDNDYKKTIIFRTRENGQSRWNGKDYVPRDFIKFRLKSFSTRDKL